MLAPSEDAAGAGRGPRRWQRIAFSLSVLLLLYGYAVALQHWNGAFRAEPSGESDEAAHFVTGLMAHDYVARGFPGAPLPFAKQFYLHYPKVAIGHWPPMMYVLLAGWMLVFPGTVHSVVFLMALLAALLAFLLYRIVLLEFGSHAIALLSGVVLLSLPLIERFGGLIMADLPVALWSFCAALAWGRYLDSERPRDALTFAMFSSLAILTKGDGFLLALLPPLTVLYGRRWGLLRKPSLWFSAALVAALCLPWTILTMKLVTPTMQNNTSWAFTMRALPFYLVQLSRACGPLILCLAVLGMVARFTPKFAPAPPSGLWLSMAALLFSDVAFHSVVPAGLEPRYLISGTFPVMLFALAGAAWLCSLPLISGLRRSLRVAITAVVIVGLFGLFNFHITPKYSFGFAEVAHDILADPALSQAAVLCSSDRDGEGLLISEIAMRERRNGHYILRASKMLASSDWNGSGYRLRFTTAAEVRRLLDSLPAGVIVIDETPGVLHYRHNDLLLQAVESSAWRLTGVYPKTKAGMAPGAHIEVYRKTGGPSRPFDPAKLSFGDLVRPLE